MSYLNEKTFILSPIDWIRVNEITNQRLSIVDNNSTYWYPINSVSFKREPLYIIEFNDGASTIVSSDHRFKVKSTNNLNTNWITKTVSELIVLTKAHNLNPPAINNYCCYGYCLPKQEPPTINNWVVESLTTPINFPEQNRCISPPHWIGVMIGKGLLGQDEPMVQLDQELYEIMMRQCPNVRRYELTLLNKEERLYGFSDFVDSPSGLSNYVTEMKNLDLMDSTICDRTIHKSLIFTDVTDRIALLRGIFDAVGYIDIRDGQLKVRVRSEPLARDLYFLIRSVGGWATVESSGIGTSWVVTAYSPKGNPLAFRKSLIVNSRLNLDPPFPIRYLKSIKPYEGSAIQDSTFISSVSANGSLISNSFSNLDLILSRP